MNLDFAALREVLSDLERLSESSARPLLGKIERLGKFQLDALGVLSACSGFASARQLWLVRYITRGDLKWEALEACAEELRVNGVIEERDGRLSFYGDDFDRIFVKYFAREHGVRCEVQDSNPVQHLQRSIIREVGIQGVGFLTTTSDEDGVAAFRQIASALASPTEAETSFASREDWAQTAYRLFSEHSSIEEIPVVRVNLSLPEFGRLSGIIYFESADALRALPNVIEKLRSFAGRAKEINGAF